MGRRPALDELGRPYTKDSWPEGVNATIVQWIIDTEDEELALKWEAAFDEAMEEERRKLVGVEEEAYIDKPVLRPIFSMMRLPQTAHEFMSMNSLPCDHYEIIPTSRTIPPPNSSFLLPPPPNLARI